MAERRLALVFSGGGAKGAFGAGVLQGLVAGRPNLRWHIVSGTSTGGLIAPFASVGSTDRTAVDDVVRLYRTVKEREVVDSNFDLGMVFKGFPRGIYNLEPLKDTIRKRLSADRRRQLVDGDVVTVLNCVNLQTGELALWTQRKHVPGLRKWFKAQKSKGGVGAHFLPEHKLEEAMLATSAIPGALEPEEFRRGGQNAPCAGTLDRQQIVDGGVLDLAPLRSAIAAGATDILAVFMSPRVPPPDCRIQGNLLAVGLRAVDLLTDEIGRNDVEVARQVTGLGDLATRLLAEAAQLPPAVAGWLADPANRQRVEKLSRKRPVNVEVIEPAHLLGDTLSFDEKVGPNWPVSNGGAKTRSIMEARYQYGLARAKDAVATNPVLAQMLADFGG